MSHLHAVDDNDTPRTVKEKQRRARHWDPVAVGDTITGTVRKVNIVPGNRLQTGIDTPVVCLDTQRWGRQDVWLARTVLATVFAQERPAQGATVTITYLGLRETSNGMATYHAYEMEVEGDTIPAHEGMDWIQAFHKRRDRATYNLPRAEDKR